MYRQEAHLLFSSQSWMEVQNETERRLGQDIRSIPRDRLLNTPVEDWCDYFEDKYKFDVAVLDRENAVIEPLETKIDVSRNPDRGIFDRSRPFYVEGTALEVTVPFQGEAESFGIRPPTSWSVQPYAEVQADCLIVRVEGANLTDKDARELLDRQIGLIEKYLSSLRSSVEGFNNQLRSKARAAIERRRQKLLSDQELAAGLGFKLKERPGVPRTYAAPEVRQKLTPRLPPTSASSFRPEPVLTDTDYEKILSIIQSMARVMELSPNAFRKMDEETLRSHFLVQLNGHYQGQATGETFNYEGKTDILVRSDGRNIFIGECKFWSGPKKLTDTLDQLLSYSSWRDTKVAVVLFSRKKDFSAVLEKIPNVIHAHPNFKRDIGVKSETIFQYVFAHRDDENREMILSVLAFDVPSGMSKNGE